MKKTVIAIVVTLLACCCVFGTTLAFLVAKTETVTNTFTFGDVNIELAETTGAEYDVVPGATIAKDPKVTVRAGSEACYLFIQIEEKNNTIPGGSEKIVSYELHSNWTALNGVAGVYYMTVSDTTATDTPYQVLAGGTAGEVTISSNVTKDHLATIAANVPALVLTAYAVQMDNVANAAAAWAIANPTT